MSGSADRGPGRRNEQRRLPILAVGGVLAVHLLLTLTLAYLLNIWQDEAYSLATTSQGLLHAIRRAIGFEEQPPLYFALLSLWRGLSSSIFHARLFSVLCVAAAVPVVARISARSWPDVHPAWVAALFALNPFTIWAATEIRAYAMLLLLAALLLDTFLEGYVLDPPSPAVRWLHAALAVASLYTHYYLGFLLVGCAVALPLLRRWRALFRFGLAMTGVALAFVPMAVIVVRQVGTASGHHGAERTMNALSIAARLWWRAKEFLLPVELGAPDRLFDVQSWTARLAVLLAVLLAVGSWRRLRTGSNVALLAVAAVTTSFFGAVLASLPFYFEPRHTTALFLPLLLCVPVVFLTGRSKAIRIAALATVAVFYSTALTQRCLVMAKMGDSTRVAEYLLARESEGQPILAFNSEAALTLRHYYRGVNRILPVPREPSLERYDLRSMVLADGGEVEALLKTVPGPHERVWVVLNGDCAYQRVSFGCEVLEDYISKHYTVEDDRPFALGSRVRLVCRKASVR